MSRYSLFLLLYILSVISLIVFLVFYINFFFSLFIQIDRYNEPDPVQVLNAIFSPSIIISGIVMGLSSLAYRILGIVWVARNQKLEGGEKALWIVGFCIMSFITGLIFLIMAKGRKLV